MWQIYENHILTYASYTFPVMQLNGFCPCLVHIHIFEAPQFKIRVPLHFVMIR